MTHPSPHSRPHAGWWALRLEIWRDLGRPSDERLWSLAEVCAAAVTLATFLWAVALILADPFVDLPGWATGTHTELLLAAAVGYGTNFLAVQMLFKPRERARTVPLGWIWRQGLIPAKQREMAEIVGQEVAMRLLTPEVVVQEFERLLTTALEVKEVQDSLQRAAKHTLDRELPAFVRRFLPDTLEALTGAITESLPAEELRRVMVDLLGDWFRSPVNRAHLAAYVLELLRSRTPELVLLLEKTLRRYQKKSSVRSFAITAGIATNIIDWDDFERALRKQLATEKSQVWAEALIHDLAGQLQVFVERAVTRDWLESVKARTARRVLDGVERVAEETLVPRIVALFEREPFQRWMREELIPAARARLLEWIRDGHLKPFLERFDVRGRVAAAAAQLDPAELEDMANRVGAYHLAAIQVLGWVLGLAVGGLGVLLSRVS